jgi:hypothetical protein
MGSAPALCVAVLLSAPILARSGTPEQRAVDYMAGEVKAWYADNRCFSCHNNGDGARALYTAAKLGYRVPADSLTETTAWLQRPQGWKKNRANPAFSDQKLADIQFAAALADGPTHKPAMPKAAELLVAWQSADGSWQIDAEAGVGSPVTWGSALATYMARRTLERFDAKRYGAAIDRATSWLQGFRPGSVLDSAALVLSGRTRAVDDLVRAQTSDGGWGPQPGAPGEPFDTAVVLLALNDSGRRYLPSITRGRAFLIRTQLDSGGWPPTTRPAGAQSYAQHISTSAWAALALMATDPERK